MSIFFTVIGLVDDSIAVETRDVLAKGGWNGLEVDRGKENVSSCWQAVIGEKTCWKDDLSI